MLFDRVSSLCESRGISLWKLEKLLNFGNGTLSKWENSCPGIDKVQKVSDFFEVSIDYLVNRGGEIPLSPDGKIVAIVFDSLSSDKQELIKKYVDMLKAS